MNLSCFLTPPPSPLVPVTFALALLWAPSPVRGRTPRQSGLDLDVPLVVRFQLLRVKVAKEEFVTLHLPDAGGVSVAPTAPVGVTAVGGHEGVDYCTEDGALVGCWGYGGEGKGGLGRVGRRGQGGEQKVGC